MTTLEELQGTPTSLDELSSGMPGRVQTTPESDRNKAAHAAVIGSEDVIQGYNVASSDMAQGSADYANTLVDRAQASRMSDAREVMYSVVSNPATDEAQKEAAVKGFMEMKTEFIDWKEMVNDDAIAAPSQSEHEADYERRLTHAEFMIKHAEAQKFRNTVAQEFVAKFENPSMGRALLEMVDLYFIPLQETKVSNDIRDAMKEGLISEGEAAFALMGNAKADTIDTFNSLPPDQQMDFAHRMLDIIDTESSTILSGENQFAAYTFIRDVLDTGHITDTQIFLENVASVAEAIPLLGGVLKSAVRVVRGTKSPASLLESINVSNPSKTRNLTNAIESDTTGEAARALSGSDRSTALADEYLPEVIDPTGPIVREKIPNQHDVENLGLRGNEDSIRSVQRTGANHYTVSEKDEAAATIVNKFRDTADIRLQGNVSAIGAGEDGQVFINAIYGGKDGGFLTAEDAIKQVMFNFRKFGMTEKDLTVLKLGDEGYTPMSTDDLRAALVDRTPGDYRTQVMFDYKINPTDIPRWAQFDVKYNLFDRILPGISQGGMRLQRNILDPASVLNPELVQSAAAAVDRSAAIESTLLDLGKSFGNTFNKLDPQMKEMVTEYISKANRDGIDLRIDELSAEGFNRDGINAISKWREAWDTQYVLENRDLAKTLRGQGFEIVEDQLAGHRLFVMPSKTKPQGTVNNVYDQAQGRFRSLTESDLDKLYKDGGFVARTRDPITLGTDETYVLVKNTKNNFSRAISDSDTVLNYRKGYYTVQYKRPVFVTKNITRGDGTVYTKVVANAKDHPTAQHFLERQASQEGKTADEWGSVRGDLNEVKLGDNTYWDLNGTAGRTAQRFRGQRLEDIDANVNQTIDQSHVVGPVDSLVHAARSTAERISMRDWVEATKVRFTNQFKELLPMENGYRQFPQSADQLRKAAAGKLGNKQLADALSTYEYIRYIESGYVNSIDNAFKSAFRGMANIVGRAGSGTGERALGWLSDQRPTGLMKNLSFRAYLATNPLRQLLVQSHQAVQLIAIEPKVATKVLMRQAPALGIMLRMPDSLGNVQVQKALEQISGMGWTELQILRDIVENSGIMKAVDRTNLLDGELKYLADSLQTSSNPAVRAVGGVETALRSVGFDLGEQYNLLTAFLTFYRRGQRAALREGRSTDVFTQSFIDKTVGQARNYTYNMNRAGDMPYNQNSFGTLMQFFQVPHKSMLTMSLNRGLTPGEKGQIFALNAIAYGVPAWAVTGWLDWALGDSPETKEAVLTGVEGYAFNKTLEWTTGEDTRIDWKGLAPLDMYGAMEMITSLWTDGIGESLSKSPPGQLLFGSNPRVTNAMKRTASFFNDTLTGVAEPKDVMKVMESWATISSGYSNLMRSKMALEYGKLYNSSGTYLMDAEVSTPEAIAVAFGFNTYDSAVEFAVGKATYESRVALEADVKVIYNDVKKVLKEEGMPIHDEEFALSAINLAWSSFDPETEAEARSMLLSLLRKDVNRGEHNVFNRALGASGIMSRDDYIAMVETLDIPEDQKRLLLSATRNVEDD